MNEIALPGNVLYRLPAGFLEAGPGINEVSLVSTEPGGDPALLRVGGVTGAGGGLAGDILGTGGGSFWNRQQVSTQTIDAWSSMSSAMVSPTPDHCAHCEEKLDEKTTVENRFCSKACQMAHQVAARLGAKETVTWAQYGGGFTVASTAISSGAIVAWQSTMSTISTTFSLYGSTR